MTYLVSRDRIHTPKQDETQVLICISSMNSAMSVCNGDTRPALSYSPASSTPGMARLCYSHFRLQVWNRKGRDPGGRSSGEVGRPGNGRGMRGTEFGCADYLVTYLKPPCSSVCCSVSASRIFSLFPDQWWFASTRHPVCGSDYGRLFMVNSSGIKQDGYSLTFTCGAAVLFDQFHDKKSFLLCETHP